MNTAAKLLSLCEGLVLVVFVILRVGFFRCFKRPGEDAVWQATNEWNPSGHWIVELHKPESEHDEGESLPPNEDAGEDEEAEWLATERAPREVLSRGTPATRAEGRCVMSVESGLTFTNPRLRAEVPDWPRGSEP